MGSTTTVRKGFRGFRGKVYSALKASMVDSSALQPRIRPLDQQCINRIAAGEVIHRPASAVRDPLLNSGPSMDAALTHLC